MKYDISEIGKLYPNWYDKEAALSYDDQKWIWENVPLPKEDEIKLRGLETSEDVNVNGNGVDTYKRRLNFELTPDKLQIIAELKKHNYQTHPPETAKLLEKLFSGYDTTPGWWLYTAQHWTPKSVRSAINQMIKVHVYGQVTIQNPAAYFTNLLQKFHPQRKVFRRINDTRKQHYGIK